MKRVLVPGVVGLLTMVTVPVVWGGTAFAATTYTVSASTGLDTNPCTAALPCKTITKALGLPALADGDTINVLAGTYAEHITIAKAINLTGAGSGSTTINANATAAAPFSTVLVNSTTLGVKPVNITGFTITGGFSNFGGGLQADAGTINVTGTIITNNTAGGVTNSTGGGGIGVIGTGFGTTPQLILNGVTVSNNKTVTFTSGSTTTAFNGGGMYVLGSGPTQPVLVTGSTFTNNVANGVNTVGGGIYAKTGFGTLPAVVTLDSTTVSGNSATLAGGGVASTASSTLTLRNSTNITGNFAPDGAGLYNEATVGITGGSISTNTASFEGGGIFSQQNGAAIPTITASGLTMTGNTAALAGGAALVFTKTSFSMTGGSVGSSSAPLGGGVYVTGGASASFNGTAITNNTANGGAVANEGLGGGIYNSGALTISNGAQLTGNKVISSTVANTITGYGGAVFDGPSATNDAPTASITNSNLSGNTAALGAAIATTGNIFSKAAPVTPGQLTASSDTISTNAAADGGGLFNGGSSTISASTFSGNSGTFEGGTIYDGSTVAADTPTITATDVAISGSPTLAVFGGDAIVLGKATLTMTRGSLSAGNAVDAGGLYVVEGGTASLNQTNVTNNTATGGTNANFGNGGGIINAGVLTVTNAEITGNKAVASSAGGNTGWGGGIYAGSSQAAGAVKTTLVGDTLTGNTATTASALIFTSTAGTNAGSISNSTVTANTTSAAGSVVVFSTVATPLTITNSTITANVAGAGSGGLYGTRSTGIAGSIVSANTASGCGIGGGFVAPTDGGYNLADPGDATCGFGLAKHDVSAAPQLGTLAANGGPTRTQLPAASSPVINVIPTSSATGLTNAVSAAAVVLCAPGASDQRGNARPQGASCDIGSVEVNVVAPTLSGPTGDTYAVGTAGGPDTFTTTGTPTPHIAETGTLPSGVTFTDHGDGTATISGTPSDGSAGSYPLTITAANGTAPNASQAFTLVVTQAPSLTGPSHDTYVVGTAGGPDTFTSSAAPTATITETGPLPSGVAFTDHGDGTATISGTPAAGTGGEYHTVIKAHNGVGSDSTVTFDLTVNDAPSLNGPASDTFTVGTAATGDSFTATGFPTPGLTSSALPTGVTFTDHGNGSATIAGTPAAGTGGVHTITVTASNGVGTDPTKTFTLTIDEAPSLTGPSSQGFETGVAGSADYSTSGYPQAALSEAGTLPAGVTFTDHGDGTASVAGTPAASAGGVYHVTVTASNGIGPDATLPVTITVGQAPSIAGPTGDTFTVGTAAAGDTFTSTGFPTPALSTSALPTGVTFTDHGDGTGTIAGTPATGTGGPHSITVTATNGVGHPASTTFALTIDEAPSVTGPASDTFTVDAPAAGDTFTATGYPVAMLTTTPLPSGVTLTDRGNGTATIAGTPASGTGGVHTITVTATNGIGMPATATFVLTIDEAPSVTGPASATFETGSAGSVGFASTGFPTPVLSTTSTLPAGVAFTNLGNGNATLAGTPAAGSGGVYTIVVNAHNGIGSDDSTTVVLTVNQPSALTGPTSDTFTVGVAGSDSFSATGTPTPAISEAAMLPSGVTFVDAGNGTATLAGTPAPGTGGVYVVTITAANGIGSNDVIHFTLTVNEAPTLAGPATARFSVGSAGTAAFTSTGFPVPMITESGALPAGVTLTDAGNGTANISGTPLDGTEGSYPITLTANNGVAPSATLSFTLTVVRPLVVTTTSLPKGAVGVPYHGQMVAIGGTTPYAWSLASGSLPAGLTMTGDGSVAGTPTAAGTSTITVRVTDSAVPAQTASKVLTIMIDRGPTKLTVNPVILSTAPLHITVGFATANLTAGNPAQPLANQPILFSAGATTICTVNTRFDGTATCVIPPAALPAVILNLGLSARYAGSATWTPATGAAGLIN